MLRVRFTRYPKEGDPAISGSLKIEEIEPCDFLEAAMNICNKHFGDPTKNIGGPKLPEEVELDNLRKRNKGRKRG